MMPGEWHDWHDFYMLLGTASAALVALLFVAVSIAASFLTPERSIATRTFMSPVVFHFSTLLLVSLVALVPSHTALLLAVGIVLVAIAGFGYTTVVLVGLARASIRDAADRDSPVGGLSRNACRGGTGYFADRTGNRTVRGCFGRSRSSSPCGKHPQRLGPDARFCAPNRKQRVGHVSDRARLGAYQQTALGARGRIRISMRSRAECSRIPPGVRQAPA